MDYIRDGRAPIPESETTSKVMSANKGKNTKPELMLRNALIDIGINNFETNLKDIPGRPDVAFPKIKLAIFVHGCFWHHCPKCNPNLPKSNTEFWKNKFEKNKQRDAKKKQILEENNWFVIVFWEHDINSDVNNCVIKIKSYLEKKSRI